MELNNNTIISATSQQVSSSLGSETVILDLAKGEYFGLNEVGSRIWEFVQQRRTISEIMAMLENEFDAPREQLLADLQEFLSRMHDAGLIETHPC